MKLSGYVLFFFLFSINLQALEVSVSTQRYFQPTSYLEIYSRILGQSVKFVGDSGNDRKASISMLITLESDGAYAYADKLQLDSPKSALPVDFWDVRKIQIKPGEYDLAIKYVDLNNINDTLVYEEKVVISELKGSIESSDILLLDTLAEMDQLVFNKSGFSFEPVSYNLFGPEDDFMIFHIDLYGVQREDLLYKFYMSNAEDLTVVTKPAYKKLKADSIVTIVEEFSIEDLPSGNYSLTVEVVDKSKQSLFSTSERFAVHHPFIDYKQSVLGDMEFETSFVQILDEGDVNYALKAIFPRVGNKLSGMLNQLIWSDDLNTKRYFLYSFWSRIKPIDTKEVYDKYMAVARAVDNKYRTNLGHGFETDRGYVFLKYGKPNDVIAVEDEASAPPYEIWVYNYVAETKQNVVKFLFYNPSLAGNDFILLHSTCRGEVSNPNWEAELYRKDGQNSTLFNSDDALMDPFSRKARRYFSDI